MTVNKYLCETLEVILNVKEITDGGWGVFTENQVRKTSRLDLNEMSQKVVPQFASTLRLVLRRHFKVAARHIISPLDVIVLLWRALPSTV